MRALSLWQPWASGIAVGAKGVETRHWATRYRGPLAIHAAKRWRPDQRDAADRLHADFPRDFFADFRLRHGEDGPPFPVGCVVALVELVDVIEMKEDETVHEPDDGYYVACVTISQSGWTVGDIRREVRWGNWHPGRYAWVFAHVRPLVEPVPLRGRQGLWTPTPQEQVSINASAGEVLV